MSAPKHVRPSIPAGGAYQTTTLLVGVEVNGVVKDIKVIGLAPFLRVLELLVGILNHPSSRAQIPPVEFCCQHKPNRLSIMDAQLETKHTATEGRREKLEGRVSAGPAPRGPF
jgi:hypothetical protein